jgi:hypothetical protein
MHRSIRRATRAAVLSSPGGELLGKLSAYIYVSRTGGSRHRQTVGSKNAPLIMIIMIFIIAANSYIFGIDRKKCCVLSRLPASLRHRGERLVHLRTSIERKARKHWRSDSSSNGYSQNGDFLSLLSFTSFPPLLITFSLLILVVLLQPVRLCFCPISSSFSYSEVKLAVEVPSSPSCQIPPF